MPDMHTIRLRHPWTCELHDGMAHWSRGFNWPAGLTPREVVWLVIDPLPADARVELNGQPLSAAEVPGRFNVTSLIGEYNRVIIQLSESTGATKSECPLDVKLEIDEG